MANTRTQNSLKNIKVGFTNKIVTMLLSFVSRRLFIQFIGIEYLGIDGLFAEVLGVLSLADLGFGTAMTYSFYRPIAEKDTKKIVQLMRFYKTVYNIIALAVASIGLSLIPFLKYIVNTDKDISHLEVYYVIFLMSIVVSYLFAYKSSIISASQKQYIVSQLQIYVLIVRTILQMIVAVFTGNYMVFLVVQVITTFINNLIVSRKAEELYPEIKNKSECLPKEEKKAIFSNLGSVFLYKLAGTLLNSTDNTLISMICGTIYVGFYANYKTITTSISAIITIFFSSLTASIGNLIITSDEKNRYKVFKSMQMVSFFFASLSIVCMYFLLDEFMTYIWLGTGEYLFDKYTLITILMNYYLATTLQPLWSYREATGLYRKTRYIMVIAAIVNLVMSIILGMKYGVGGIILASFIAKIVTYVWYEPKLLFEEYFKVKSVKYFAAQFCNVAMLALSLLLAYFCVDNIVADNIYMWIIKAIICIGIVSAVYFLRYFRTNEFMYIVSKIRKA